MILIFFKKIKSNHFCLAEKKAYDIFLQLNKMTLDELHNMYLEMIPILKHNYNLMLDYGKSEENFLIDYKKRIINNYV